MMEISRKELEKVISKLPIGFYAGRRIKISLSDNDSSYYDLLNDEIKICDKLINDALSKISDDKIDPDQIEKDVRALVYHEVSHAILTPQSLGMTPQMNIMEDQRIETLLERTYMNVDFREFRHRVLDDPSAPDTDINAFLRLVRLDDGPIEFIKMRNVILKSFKDLDRSYDLGSYQGMHYSYTKLVNKFYQKFCEWRKSHKNQIDKSDNNQSANSDQMTKLVNDLLSEIKKDPDLSYIDTGCLPYKLSDADMGFSWNEDGYPKDESLVDKSTGSGQSSQKSIRSLFDSITDRLIDKKLINSLNEIFISAKKIEKNQSASINSYSGMFDPRSAGRDDYKYFLQSNRLGQIKKWSKVHVNLFLDRSSSFMWNEEAANQILYALNKIERENEEFSYTLITCGIGESIEKKEEFVYHAWDGTAISNQIFDTYKKVQDKNAVNYNIVLYDGRAFDKYSKEGEDGHPANFKAFNHENCLLILDDTNQSVIKYLDKAHVVITNKYIDNLKKYLIRSLKQIVRI